MSTIGCYCRIHEAFTSKNVPLACDQHQTAEVHAALQRHTIIKFFLLIFKLQTFAKVFYSQSFYYTVCSTINSILKLKVNCGSKISHKLGRIDIYTAYCIAAARLISAPPNSQLQGRLRLAISEISYAWLFITGKI